MQSRFWGIFYLVVATSVQGMEFSQEEKEILRSELQVLLKQEGDCAQLIEHVKNAKQNDVEEVLYEAIDLGFLPAVKFLLSFDLPVNTMSRLGMPLLHQALFSKSEHRDMIARMLIEAGVDVRTIAAATGKTALHICEQVELIDALVDRGADVNAKDAYGSTPLVDGIFQSKSSELIEKLLERGADINYKSPDLRGRTPLFYAMSPDENQCFFLLASKGADLCAIDWDGQTPFEEAICLRNPTLAAYFLERGLSPNYLGASGYYLLHQAVKHESCEIVRLLIDAGANINAREQRQGLTPLHIAAEKNLLEIAEMLILEGTDINAKTYNGRSALHIAASEDCPGIAHLLLSNGADIHQCDFAGKGVLQHALEGIAAETFQLLLDWKADASIVNFEGKTLLHQIAQSTYYDQESLSEIVRMLIGKLPIGVKDLYGSTPLHYAVCNQFCIFKQLLEAGANPNVKNYLGETPLHRLEPSKLSRKYAELLIQKGADVNVQDSSGKTPLHHMTYYADIPMSELLLSRGADPTIQDKKGMSPLEIARTESEHHGRFRPLAKLFSNFQYQK